MRFGVILSLTAAALLVGCEAGIDVPPQLVSVPPALNIPAPLPSLPAEELQRLSTTKSIKPLPSYQWPADFVLPLDIVILTPEVPKAIQGPTPLR